MEELRKTLDDARKSIRVNEAMFVLMRALRAKNAQLRVFALSNMSMPDFEFLREPFGRSLGYICGATVVLRHNISQQVIGRSLIECSSPQSLACANQIYAPSSMYCLRLTWTHRLQVSNDIDNRCRLFV